MAGLPGSIKLIIASAVVRAAMIAWGHYQDHHFQVKYTDIDYQVFTDAARYVAAGESPYRRATYRYSPLLAYMMLPNVYFHPACGKVLFAAADIIAALLLKQLFSLQHTTMQAGPKGQDTTSQHQRHQRYLQYALLAWLYNPYTFTISTRGSCDALIAVLLLLLLRVLAWRGSTLNNLFAGFLYGFAVHFRVYPIIYAPALGLFLLRRQYLNMAASAVNGQNPNSAAEATAAEAAGAGRQRNGTLPCSLARVLQLLAPAAAFGVAAAGMFIALGVLFYRMYGMLFLHETFLYHSSRQDPRHSFSPYYYPTYLSMSAPQDISTALTAQHHRWAAAAERITLQYGPNSILSLVLRLLVQMHPWLVQYIPDAASAAWLPQVVCLLALSLRFHADLPVALMLCTWVFVTFNKVVTAQYFVWYLSLLPLALPGLLSQQRVRGRSLLCAGAVWVAAQLHWLAWAYQLEMQGRPVHLAVWAAGIAFMASNVAVITALVYALAPASVPGAHSTHLTAGEAASFGAACTMTFLDACTAADRESQVEMPSEVDKDAALVHETVGKRHAN